MNDLQTEFARLARNGFLGDPSAADAYAYLRASSERQVEEGSSFTRQIQNIHQVALREKLRVPFELIYFDDGYTGFEFEHRPALLKLRFEIRTKPRASHLIIEDIDRLSRNADWQQGFLLEEFYRASIQICFYIDPGSSLERYIRGFMAQEEMKKAKERMRMGNIYKAMSGKVTAKRPRYGYIITKDSQYEFHPEESQVMRWVYEQLIYHQATLHQIATEMNEKGVPTRFKTGFWTPSTLVQLVKSPVYKGDFYANRHYGVKTGEYREDGKPKHKMVQRPRSEWIHVPVPAIVTPEEWDKARQVLTQNAKTSSRNAKKRSWLLSGLMKCATCRKYTLHAVMGNTKKNPRRYYRCGSHGSQKARFLKTACGSPHIYADVLEQRVWEEIENIIYDPNIIIQRLEEKSQEEHLMSYKEHLEFIDSQLSARAKEQKKFEAAYQRDIYTLDEFEEKVKNIKTQIQALSESRVKVEEKIAATYEMEDKKAVVLEAIEKVRGRVEQARQTGRQLQVIPFELKRKILSLMVEAIWVDAKEGTFTIDGVIKGVFSLDNDKPSSSATSGSSGDFGFSFSLR